VRSSRFDVPLPGMDIELEPSGFEKNDSDGDEDVHVKDPLLDLLRGR
jgi:hypothetical protein